MTDAYRVESRPLISVLIPSRERPGDLRRCIDSLLACDHPSFEVVVIEQGATLTDLPLDPRLRHVLSNSTGKSAALNEGIRIAQGDILAFTDDDCTLPAGWLSGGERVLREHPRVGLVFGQLQGVDHDPSREFIPEFRPERFEVVASPSRAFVRGGAGANIFMRREAMLAIKGFDARIGPGARFRSNEEFDVYYRVLRAGFAVARDPDNPVLHWGVRSYADGSGQRLMRGYYYGEGAVLGKHIRCGDRTAMALSVRIAFEQIQAIGQSARRGRPFTGIGRSAYWLKGLSSVFLAGGLNRQTRLFNG